MQFSIRSILAASVVIALVSTVLVQSRRYANDLRMISRYRELVALANDRTISILNESCDWPNRIFSWRVAVPNTRAGVIKICAPNIREVGFSEDSLEVFRIEVPRNELGITLTMNFIESKNGNLTVIVVVGDKCYVKELVGIDSTLFVGNGTFLCAGRGYDRAALVNSMDKPIALLRHGFNNVTPGITINPLSVKIEKGISVVLELD